MAYSGVRADIVGAPTLITCETELFFAAIEKLHHPTW
jgi:hypothetical protein